MDVFAGRSSRPRHVSAGPPRSGHRAGSRTPILPPAPTWCSCNFRRDCIRDATGVWLKAYVFTVSGYILSFADPNKTENVVINLSYGPTTGPHDGTAELEAALTALVSELRRHRREAQA